MWEARAALQRVGDRHPHPACRAAQWPCWPAGVDSMGSDLARPALQAGPSTLRVQGWPPNLTGDGDASWGT